MAAATRPRPAPAHLDEWTAAKAQALIGQVVGLAGDAECEAALAIEAASHTRFARNEITTSGRTEDLTLRVTLRHDAREGSVTTNDLSPAGLKEAVARAETLRALSPPDPEMMETLPKQDYPALGKFHPETAAAGPADRARAIREALRLARKEGLTAAGFYENNAAVRAIGNSRGNFGYHRATEASFSTTMRTADATGSGWAAAGSPRLPDIDPKAVAARAAGKGLASARPRRVEPGDYTVVLEPAAVANLLAFLGFGVLSARAADEGRSVFSKEGGGSRVGETIFPETISIATDPFDPRVPATPWSGAGPFSGGLGDPIPNRRVAWIEKGVLKALQADRYWAQKTGREATPFPGGLVMAGGTATLADLIASTGRGLLVTHFWYIRTVNPQTAQLTGLTRDGLFLIEKGRIAGPAMNLRFNESPIVMLQNAEALAAPEPAGGMVVPAIRSRAFTFTSVSDAV